MNYIRHLTGYFDRVCKDHRLNPTHISIYMAIFQFWNLNRFKNPLSISRSEIMGLSKVSSKNTYHKVMKELHQYGYFRYDPSYHPLRGSWVYMLAFATATDTNQHKKETGAGQVLDKQETSAVQPEDQLSSESRTGHELQSSLNISKRIKHTKLLSDTKENIVKRGEDELRATSEQQGLPPAEKNVENRQVEDDQNLLISAASTVSRVLCEQPPERVPKNLEVVMRFFTASEYPPAQASKFFHYYNANGWKIGGKAPIENWQSAAHSWMLHDQNTHVNGTDQKNNSSASGANRLHASANKNYSEPL